MTRVQILFVLLVSVVGGVFLCNTLFGPFRHMGRVERLNSPVTITGWTERGLQTADGRLVEIPNIRHLPASSLAISEFTKRELMERLDVASAKIHVIPPGIDHAAPATRQTRCESASASTWIM